MNYQLLNVLTIACTCFIVLASIRFIKMNFNFRLRPRNRNEYELAIMNDEIEFLRERIDSLEKQIDKKKKAKK